MNRKEWNKAVPREHRAPMLRTCNAGMMGYGGFRWPRRGYVEAPDWEPRLVYGDGGGLHGALRGDGNGAMFNWAADATWMVVEVDAREVVDLGGSTKVPRGWVVYAGGREDALKLMSKAYPGAPMIGVRTTAGFMGTAAAGWNGRAVAGPGGMAVAGYEGHAVVDGHGGTAVAGNFGMAFVANDGTAVAMDHGVAAGDDGRAVVGLQGTAAAGDGGVICVRWYDGSRYRLAVGYVGEDGIEPGVAYRCSPGGRLVRAEKMR